MNVKCQGLTPDQNPVKQIWKYGQSVWYDGFVQIPEFKKMIQEDGIRGATTNPTIFEKALSSHEYDAELSHLAESYSAEEIYKILTVKSVQEVADVFQPLHQETKGQDGFVSIEVSPLLAYDTERTREEARELWRLVDRGNVMIKVPATRAGLPAIRTLISEGINVNITLIFSIERYHEVMEAYLEGLENRLKAGKPLAGIASVASFFVSRVDTTADKLIEEKKGLEGFLGKTAIANSKLAYADFEKTFSSPRFKALAEQGAQVQRPLWASTGTKNPRYSDILYVESLIGPSTVNTMPPVTLDAFRDHGVAAPRLREGLSEAGQVLDILARAGIDLAEITRKLEENGVELFADSYKKLIRLIESKKK